MNLEDAIKHCEEVMVENLEKNKDRNASDPIAIDCFECADEHRQLAEWLRDYKRLKEQTEITWVAGADGAKVAFWDVPIPKVLKICKILQEPSVSEIPNNYELISKQAVLDMCKKEIDHISKNWQNYHSPSEAKSGFVYIATNIYDLPPETPQQNEGHWIKSLDGYGNYHFTCPFCDHDIATKCDVWDDNYCSNCGARLSLPKPYAPDRFRKRGDK